MTPALVHALVAAVLLGPFTAGLLWWRAQAQHRAVGKWDHGRVPSPPMG